MIINLIKKLYKDNCLFLYRIFRNFYKILFYSNSIMPEIGLWHFRVHYEPRKAEEIISFIKDRAEMVLAVRETDANRPHIHSVISEFKQTKSTFVQQFLKEFPELKGNGQYSCSKKDDLEAQLRYCCKGDSEDALPDVLYGSIDYLKYHNHFWEENLLLKAKSKTEYQLKGSENVKPKAKSKTWTEKVFDEIKQLYPEHVRAIQEYPKEFIHTDDETKRERESRIVIYCYFKKRLGCKKQSHYLLRDMFTGLMSGLINEGSQEASDKYNINEYNMIFDVKI